MIYITTVEKNGHTREYCEESLTPELVVLCKNFILGMKEGWVFSLTSNMDFEYDVEAPPFYVREATNEEAATVPMFSVEEMADKFLVFAMRTMLKGAPEDGHLYFVAKY